MSLAVFDGVRYAYPGGSRPALRDVSLTIEAGEFVVLAGASGSGKSTFLRALAGLVPHFHGGTWEGRLAVAGHDVRGHGPAELAEVTGYLAQDPETQVLMGTVRAELAFPLGNRGLGAAAVARGVEEAALALGVAELLDRPTHALSGGELQRVALGAALAGRPLVLALDEPTAQLDPVAGDELLGVLRRINEEWGTAIVLAEHRLERCLPAADRVIALEDGAVAHDADPRGFLRRAAPGLTTAGAELLAEVGVGPPPVSVKDARGVLRRAGLLGDPGESGRPGGAAEAGRPGGGAGPRETASMWPARPVAAWAQGRRARGPAPALELRGVWRELRDGPVVLRDASLRLAPGERVALMGRNGAGKSSLLRVAAGLDAPTRGTVSRAGRVALLLQHPGDYLLADRVVDELSAPALALSGLEALAERHPRDLSGGERQRLALAIVLDAPETPAAVLLDEPTRGMDRAHRDALAARLRALAAVGAAVLVATHDAEFAAAWAERVVLLGDGRPVADAPVEEVLGGGWYFATQTARILGGGALTPAAGAAVLRARRAALAEGAPGEASSRAPARTAAGAAAPVAVGAEPEAVARP